MESMSGRQDDHHEEMAANNSPVKAVHDLLAYVNSPTNHLMKYVEEITSHALSVTEETERVILKKENELKETREKIINLQTHVLRYDKERRRYRAERNDLRQKDTHEKNVHALKQELERIRAFDQDYKKLETKLKDTEETCGELIKEQQLNIEQLERDLKKRETDVVLLKKKLEEDKFGFSDLGGLRNKVEKSEKRLNDTNDRLQKMKSKLRKTEEELDETKTRLSKAMGNQLTDNNPSIADLSDKNRPTKLAERYTELYDNQWTDAYEQLEKMYRREEDIIEALVKLLEDASSFCKQMTQKQMLKIQNALTMSDENSESEGVPSMIMKQMKDCRRVMANESSKHIYKQYRSKLRTSSRLAYALDIEEFAQECIEISWLMAVQDPSVVFATRTKGESFDTDMYKHYTRSGQLVEYVVWPALLLHQDGPVLAKGVAQGYNKGSRDTTSKGPRNATTYITTEFFNNKYVPSLVNPSRYSGSASPVHGNSKLDSNVLARRNEEPHRLVQREEEKRTEYSEQTHLSRNTAYWKPHGEFNRDPTREELKRYFDYVDNYGEGYAKNVLGGQVFHRCKQNEHKRYIFMKY